MEHAVKHRRSSFNHDVKLHWRRQTSRQKRIGALRRRHDHRCPVRVIRLLIVFDHVIRRVHPSGATLRSDLPNLRTSRPAHTHNRRRGGCANRLRLSRARARYRKLLNSRDSRAGRDPGYFYSRLGTDATKADLAAFRVRFILVSRLTGARRSDMYGIGASRNGRPQRDMLRFLRGNAHRQIAEHLGAITSDIEFNSMSARLVEPQIAVGHD